MTIPEIPPPEEGELPVTVAEAAEETGYSKSRLQKRIRTGILPAWLPMGCQRGRVVYVSQVRYVMERPVDTNDSRLRRV